MANLSLRTLRRLVVLLAAIIFALILYRWISQERLQYFAAARNFADPDSGAVAHATAGDCR